MIYISSIGAEEIDTINNKIEFLKELLSSHPCPFYIIDVNSYKIIFSNSDCNILYKANNVTNISDNNIHINFTSDDYRHYIDEIKKNKSNMNLRYIQRYKDDIARTIQINAIPIYNNDSKVTHVLWFEFDVTDYKEIREELIRREKLYRETLTLISDPVFIVDIKGHFLFICSNVDIVFGIDELELMKKYDSIYEIFGNDFFDINKLLKVGEIKNIECEIIDAYGIKHVLLVNVKKIPMETNKILVIGRDITKIKKSQLEVIKTRNKLKNIINSASEFIFAIDIDQQITLWNNTAKDVTGLSKKQIMNKSLDEVDIFVDQSIFQFELTQLLNFGKKSLKHMILKSDLQMTRIFDFSCSIINDEKGELEGILFIGEDITFDMELQSTLISGVSYLQLDCKDKQLVNLLKSIVSPNNKGLLVTRKNPNMINNDLIKNPNIEIVLMQEYKLGAFETINDLTAIISKIKAFTRKNKKSIVMLEGVYYLISLYSFNEFLKLLFQINELILENNANFIVNVDSKIIDEKQLSLLYDELVLLELETYENLKIKDEYYQILQFIDKENGKNIEVTIGKIKDAFQITSPTVVKRVKYLKNNVLITERKHGRTKILTLTEKGKNFLK